MLNLELLINVLARGTFGLFSATILGFSFWWLMWVSFDTSNSDLTSFFLVQAQIVGFPAAAITIVAWWNTQSSRKIHGLFIILTIVAAVVGAWLLNEIRGVNTHNALVGGVMRVPVFSLSHMLGSMIFGAALGGNAIAAIFYLYRALRHREF